MPEKLLVIDDEASIAKIVEKIAAGVGYDVATVTEPTQAIPTFERFAPDIVLVDMVMPGVDGIDILRDILAQRPETRVIAMSGHGPGYLKLAKAVAAFDHCPDIAELAKPFRRVDLLAVLRRAGSVAPQAARQAAEQERLLTLSLMGVSSLGPTDGAAPHPGGA